MKLLGSLSLCAISLCAQTAETVFFRAQMLSSNEVPAASVNAGGSATIRAHVVRDANGQIASGSVDFLVDYSFPGAVTLTGLHIHPGAAGVAGPVTISSGLASTADATGKGMLNQQGQVLPDNSTGLATLRGMVDGDPAQYYVNLHTTDNPGGAMRGQLQRAERRILMTSMLPQNEVPAIPDLPASAAATVTVIAARDAHGVPTSAQVTFAVNYRFPPGTTFTGLHIHPGAAGINGGVVLSSGVTGGAGSVQVDASGSGSIERVIPDVDLTDAQMAAATQALFDNPTAYYINIHTTEHPGGAARGQLQTTDEMVFQENMQPANEVPPVASDGSALADLHVHTLRAGDGTVAMGTVVFDVNYRFPGQTTFTGLHIHDGSATVAGPVRISSGLAGANSVASDMGFGNVYRVVTVSDDAGVNTLNGVTTAPENEYVNIHTTDFPGGVARAQLGPPNTAPPTISAVMAANLDRNALTIAPGGLVTVFGTNLAKVTTDLSGWHGSQLPDSLNGVAIAIGGQRGRLLYVSPTQVNAEAAFETPTGPQLLSVNNDNAPSAPVTVKVATTAPATFFDLRLGSALALKNSDFSLVSPANPATAGEVVLLYLTGLGQTNPALTTGMVVPSTPQLNTAPVTVTIGGQNASVVYAIASPGFVAGVYQVAVQVPAGLTPGNLPVVVTSGTMSAGAVTLAVR